ncbi:MAG: NADH-quinone oxidoreductase subunit M, partial [Fluviibacter sp.]
MSGYPLLSLAIWIPIVAGLLILAVGRDSNPGLSRILSLIGALAGLLITFPLYTNFDASSTVMQFVELAPWIPRFNINYHLGVDGISMPFIILNSFITLIVVLA